MGYSHYWRRPQTIADEIWSAIRRDFERLLLPLHDQGVELAGGLGTGSPEINDKLIRFNGIQDCGHPKNDELIIPYPSDDAQGIGPSATAIEGDYGFGATVRHRCCAGRCSYETFVIQKSVMPNRIPDKNGLCPEWVKTGFRPYDIAVTAALVVAKRHLRDQLIIHSNGGEAQWIDARRICQEVLGYGDWFGIVEERIVENWPEPREVMLRVLIETQPPSI